MLYSMDHGVPRGRCLGLVRSCYFEAFRLPRGCAHHGAHHGQWCITWRDLSKGPHVFTSSDPPQTQYDVWCVPKPPGLGMGSIESTLIALGSISNWSILVIWLHPLAFRTLLHILIPPKSFPSHLHSLHFMSYTQFQKSKSQNVI